MKSEERERLLDLVEGLVVRGYNRPGEIAKNVGIGRNTAARYLRIVLRRITNRTTTEDRNQKRAVAVEAARETLRRAWAANATAMNSNDFSAAVGALRAALQAQERIAKLYGLDVERYEIGFNQQEMDEASEAILASTPIRNGASAVIAARRALEGESGQTETRSNASPMMALRGLA
jgi:hypothetical protein